MFLARARRSCSRKLGLSRRAPSHPAGSHIACSPIRERTKRTHGGEALFGCEEADPTIAGARRGGEGGGDLAEARFGGQRARRPPPRRGRYRRMRRTRRHPRSGSGSRAPAPETRSRSTRAGARARAPCHALRIRERPSSLGESLPAPVRSLHERPDPLRSSSRPRWNPRRPTSARRTRPRSRGSGTACSSGRRCRPSRSWCRSSSARSSPASRRAG